MLFDLVRGDCGRAVVGHGGGHDEGVSVHGVCLDSLKQVGGGGERNGLYKRHGRQRAASGRQQRDVCAAQHTGAGHGVAHLAGGVVRQVAHGVHRLLRGTGRDDDLFAFKVFRAGQLPQDVVDQHTLIGQAPRADVAAGQHAGAGRDDREAVVFQRFEVILGDGVFEHVGVHGGRDQLGAGRGQRDGGQHVVGLTVGQLGDNIGRGRGDEHQICRVGKAAGAENHERTRQNAECARHAQRMAELTRAAGRQVVFRRLAQAVQTTPDEVGQPRAVPQAADEEGYHQVSVLARLAAPAAAQRNIDVIPQPLRQADVPSRPDVLDRVGKERLAEVFRQVQAQHLPTPSTMSV